MRKMGWRVLASRAPNRRRRAEDRLSGGVALPELPLALAWPFESLEFLVEERAARTSEANDDQCQQRGQVTHWDTFPWKGWLSEKAVALPHAKREGYF